MESRPNSSQKAKTLTDKASSDDQKDGFLVSCWGRLKTMKLIPWTKRRSSRTASVAARRGVVGTGAAPPVTHPRHPVKQIVTSCDCKSIAESLSVVQPRPVAGGFKYDAFSYSQNFDEGSWQDYDIEAFQRGFSSRYAVPNLARPHPHPHPHPTPQRSLIDE